jgi:hypothetical protein
MNFGLFTNFMNDVSIEMINSGFDPLKKEDVESFWNEKLKDLNDECSNLY